MRSQAQRIGRRNNLVHVHHVLACSFILLSGWGGTLRAEPLYYGGTLNGSGAPDYMLLLGGFSDDSSHGISNWRFRPEDNIRGIAGEWLGDQQWFIRNYTDAGGGNRRGWNFDALMSPNDNTHGFAYIEVWAPSAGSRSVCISSDDSAYAWVNGTLIGSAVQGRGWDLNNDQNCWSATFNAGWNRVLVAVDEVGGGWGLVFRISGLENQPWRIPVQNGSNLLKNANFETTNAKYWGFTNADGGGGNAYWQQGTTGFWYPELSPRSGNAHVEKVVDGASFNAYAFQTVAVVPSREYHFGSWFILNSNGPDVLIRYYINWHASDGTYLGQVVSEDMRRPGNTNAIRQWGGVTGTSPSNAFRAACYINFVGAAGTFKGGVADDAVMAPSGGLVDSYGPNDPSISVSGGCGSNTISWTSRGQPSKDFTNSTGWNVSNSSFIDWNFSQSGEPTVRIRSDSNSNYHWVQGNQTSLTGPAHYSVDFYTSATNGIPHILGLEGQNYRVAVLYDAVGNYFMAQIARNGTWYSPARTLTLPTGPSRNAWYTVELAYYTSRDYNGSDPGGGEGNVWCCVYPRGEAQKGRATYGINGFPTNWTYYIMSWSNSTAGYSILANFRGVDYSFTRSTSLNGTYTPVGGVFDDFGSGLGQWSSPTNGGFSTATGRLKGTDSGGGNMMYAGSSFPTLTDFVLEYTLINANDAGIILRSQGGTNHDGVALIIRASGGDMYWHIRTGGAWGTELNRVSLLGTAGSYSSRGPTRETMRIKVVVQDSTFRAYVDGIYMTGLDTTQYPSGKISMWSYLNTDEYDDLIIYPLYSGTSLTDSSITAGQTYYYTGLAKDAVDNRSNILRNLDFREGGYNEYGTTAQVTPRVPMADWTHRYYHTGQAQYSTNNGGGEGLSGGGLWIYSPAWGTGTDGDFRSGTFTLAASSNYLLQGFVATYGVSLITGPSPNAGTLYLYDSAYGWSGTGGPRTPQLTGANNWTRVQTVATTSGATTATQLLLGSNWGQSQGQTWYSGIRLDAIKSVLANCAPTAVSLTPSTGSYSTNAWYTFTTVHSDGNGFADITECRFLIKSSINGTNAIYLLYDENNHRISIRDDANTAWLGNVAPGTAGTYQNSQGYLDTGATTVTKTGNTITIAWRIQFKESANILGFNNGYVLTYDPYTNSGWQDRGDITITSGPTVGTVTPSSGTYGAENAYTFTATYLDTDGFNDVATAQLIIGPVDANNAIWVHWSRDPASMYIYQAPIGDVAGAWVGGAVGANQVVESTFGKLLLKHCSVSGSGNTRTVVFSIALQPGFNGSQPISLLATDTAGGSSGWVQKGTLTLDSNNLGLANPAGSGFTNVTSSTTPTLTWSAVTGAAGYLVGFDVQYDSDDFESSVDLWSARNGGTPAILSGLTSVSTHTLIGNHGATSDGKYYYASNSGVVARYDKTLTQVGSNISVTNIYTGIAWDPARGIFWGVDWNSSPRKIRVYNRDFSAGSLSGFPLDIGNEPIGVATDGTYLYTADRNGYVYRHQISPAVANQASINLNTLGGFTWEGQGIAYHDGYLYVGSGDCCRSGRQNPGRIYKIDIRNFSSPSVVGWVNSGLAEIGSLATDGENLLASTRTGSARLLRLESSSGWSGLYMNWPSGDNGAGRNFENNGSSILGFETGQSTSGYDTNDYPYMSMSYKLDTADSVNMLIYIAELPGWRSITMTQGESPTTYPKVASWNSDLGVPGATGTATNLVVDGRWHHKVINLDAQLDASLGTGTHTVRAVIWHTGGGGSTPVGQFWIDDFMIGKYTTSTSYTPSSALPAGSRTFYVRAMDSAGNLGAVTSKAFTIDTDVPTVTINQKTSAPAQADPTNTLPINFTVVFSEPVIGFDGTDVTIGGTAGGTKTVNCTTSNDITWNCAVSGATSSGTIIASIAAGRCTDLGGNGNLASTSTDNTVTYDINPPTVTINQKTTAPAQADPTSSTPINFTAIFSETVAGFDASDISFTGTTAPGPIFAVVTGGPTTYNVAVSGMTASGLVKVSIPAAAASDAAGNPNNASTSTDNQVTYDVDNPIVTTLTPSTTGPTNASSITFTVIFSEPVTGFDSPSDVTITHSGTAHSGVTFTPNPGDPAYYSVIVEGITGTGSFTLRVNAGAAVDYSDNPNTVSSNSAAVSIDNTVPTVSSINRFDPLTERTNRASVTFRVTFSEAVSGVNAADFQLEVLEGAITGHSISSVSTISSSIYNVTVNTGTGDGVLRLNLIDDDSIKDAATNPLYGAGQQDYTSGQQYIIDKTNPNATVNIASGTTNPTNASSVEFAVTFDKAVTDFDDPADVDVEYTGTVSSSGITFNPLSASSYLVTLTGVSGTGTIRMKVVQDAAIDEAENPNNASAYSSPALQVDTVPPTVAITRKTGQANPTNATSVQWTVTFTDGTAVTGLTTSNLQLVAGGGVTGAGTPTFTVVSAGSNTYTVTASTGTGDGTLGLNMVNSTGVADIAGNPVSGLPATGEVFDIDKTAPVVSNVTSSTADGSYMAGASISIQVVFSKNVVVTGTPRIELETGVTDRQVNYTSGSGTSTLTFTYTVQDGDITPDLDYTGTGALTLNGGTIKDAATNNALLTLAVPGESGSLGANKDILIDAVRPTVISVERNTPSSQQTNAASVTWRVTFSEDINASTSQTGDFTITKVSGTITGYSVSGVAQVSTTEFDVTISTGSGNGELRLDVLAAATIGDLIGNDYNANFTSGQTYIIDKTAPTITLRNPTAGAVVGDPLTSLSVTFSESVDGTVEAADLTINGSPATGVSGSGAGPYTFTFTNPANGTVNVSLGTGIADPAGNPFAGSNWTYQKGTPPQILSRTSHYTHGAAGDLGFAITHNTWVVDPRSPGVQDIRMALSEPVERVSGSSMLDTVVVETSATGSAPWTSRTPAGVELLSGDTVLRVALATSGPNAPNPGDYIQVKIVPESLKGTSSSIAIENNNASLIKAQVRSVVGDTTLDGAVNTADVTAIRDAIIAETPLTSETAYLDLNHDGIINTIDLALAKSRIGG